MQRLAVFTVDPAALAPGARDHLIEELYPIQARVFDGVSRAEFAAYVVRSPAARTRIQVYRDGAGGAVGYCACHFFLRVVRGRPAAVLRMESGMDQAFRGRTAAGQLTVREALVARLRWPLRDLYFLGALVHPSSYVAFARIVSDTWPRPGAETPPEIAAAMVELAEGFSLPPVPGRPPGVRRVGWITREGDAERARWRQRGALARFFVQQNPGYPEGEGLLTLFRIDAGVIARSAVRLVRQSLARRAFTRAASSGAPG